METTHELMPGQSAHLEEMSPKAKAWYAGDRETAETEFKALRDELIELQTRLYAESRRKLLVIFQAMDAGGKDGTIRNVFRGVNPQGVRVHSFKVPSQTELAHDFLWRIHQVVPETGMIGVFNRSQYEDVLVVRVHHIVPESVWRPRYDHINHFEQLLTDTGTTILKFYLHISYQEQQKRFQERLDDPQKHWKFSAEDLEKRKYWDDYMRAYEEMLLRCTTPYAPWYVIPADQKWYRDLAIMRVLVQTLHHMNPQYPTNPANLDDITLA